MKTQRVTTETHVDYMRIGLLLREARETQRLHPDEIAATLRFRAPWVDAIERGDFSVFPSLVYAKGYLANYAKFLGMDEVLHNPPVKEVLVEAAEISRKSMDATSSSAKVVQKVVQATPLPSSSKMPVDAVHVVATSSVRDRRAQHQAAQQAMKGMYWALIVGLIAVIGWMLQDRATEQGGHVSDVRAVPHEVVPEKTLLVTASRVFMEQGMAVPAWLMRDCAVTKISNKKTVGWPACYALQPPYYQRSMASVLQFQRPMMVIH
jgi:hypothetical protein